MDAKDYGLGNAVDSSVITYFNPLMHTAVFRVYAEGAVLRPSASADPAPLYVEAGSTKRSLGINRPMALGRACPSLFDEEGNEE